MLVHTLLPAEIQCKRREKKYLTNHKETGKKNMDRRWGGGRGEGKREIKLKKNKKK